MFYKQIKERAEAMGIPVKQAVAARIRYLTSEAGRLETTINELAESHTACRNDTSAALLMADLIAATAAKNKLLRQVDLLRRQERGGVEHDPVSDSEIEAANAVPMTKLIEFVRGKAKAPCHDDRTPSMFYGARKNIAVCPVCDRKWTPISWCKDQLGLPFRDAVQYLLGL